MAGKRDNGVEARNILVPPEWGSNPTPRMTVRIHVSMGAIPGALANLSWARHLRLSVWVVKNSVTDTLESVARKETGMGNSQYCELHA